MTSLSRSHEPIVWSLFGAGGMVVAFLLPALVIISGFLLPLGVPSHEVSSYARMLSFAQSWPGAVFLLVVVALPLFHAAHRIYHGLHDLHINGPNAVMFALCYGSAAILSLLALLSLLAMR